MLHALCTAGAEACRRFCLLRTLCTAGSMHRELQESYHMLSQ